MAPWDEPLVPPWRQETVGPVRLCSPARGRAEPPVRATGSLASRASQRAPISPAVRGHWQAAWPTVVLRNRDRGIAPAGLAHTAGWDCSCSQPAAGMGFARQVGAKVGRWSPGRTGGEFAMASPAVVIPSVSGVANWGPSGGARPVQAACLTCFFSLPFRAEWPDRTRSTNGAGHGTDGFTRHADRSFGCAIDGPDGRPRGCA